MAADAGTAAGHHFRWDLDKTYLQTEFDTLKDLVTTFRQKASEKVTVPGAAQLLRELLTPGAGGGERRVTFISGSPRQMRQVLTEKLRLDGIEPDDFILKDNLGNLLRLRLRALRGQVGYKLGALLGSRVASDAASETLFGDDAEMDAFIYSIYGDILRGRVDSLTLDEVLTASGVHERERQRILAAFGALGADRREVVGRIYIHLDRRSPPGRFSVYGGRVVPVFNYFQAALMLHQDGLMPEDALLRVAESMGQDGYDAERLANSLQDLMRRGFLEIPTLARLEALLAESDGILDQPASVFTKTFGHAVRGLERMQRKPIPRRDDIDYLLLAYGRRYHKRRLVMPRLTFLR